MKKPEELEELLDNLKLSKRHSSVELGEDTPHAVVYIREKTLQLSGAECLLLLDTPTTVKQLVDALSARELSLEFHDMLLTDEVLTALEEHFSTVDEI